MKTGESYDYARMSDSSLDFWTRVFDPSNNPPLFPVSAEADEVQPLFPPSDGVLSRSERAVGVADGMGRIMKRLPPPNGRRPLNHAQREWVRETAFAIVDFGERYAREVLRRRGLPKSDIEAWLKAAKDERLDEYLSTAVDQRRAIIADRLEDVYFDAKQACDLKAMTTSLKTLALVTGVVKVDEDRGPGELAQLAKELSRSGGKAALVIDQTKKDDDGLTSEET